MSFNRQQLTHGDEQTILPGMSNAHWERLRRKESQRQWASRIGVSVPTLARMERGDASVSVGTYATALWMMGRTQALANLADPVHDLGALEADIRAARQIRAARTQASINARLAKADKAP
jgi:transcriptional regulator with XRE-family HTH domain